MLQIKENLRAMIGKQTAFTIARLNKKLTSNKARDMHIKAYFAKVNDIRTILTLSGHPITDHQMILNVKHACRGEHLIAGTNGYIEKWEDVYAYDDQSWANFSEYMKRHAAKINASVTIEAAGFAAITEHNVLEQVVLALASLKQDIVVMKDSINRGHAGGTAAGQTPIIQGRKYVHTAADKLLYSLAHGWSWHSGAGCKSIAVGRPYCPQIGFKGKFGQGDPALGKYSTEDMTKAARMAAGPDDLVHNGYMLPYRGCEQRRNTANSANATSILTSLQKPTAKPLGDSACTNVLVRERDKNMLVNITYDDVKPLQVRAANNGIMRSIGTGDIAIPMANGDVTIQGHIFRDSDLHDSSFGLPELTNIGCRVILTKDDITVLNDADIPIIRSRKQPQERPWRLEMEQLYNIRPGNIACVARNDGTEVVDGIAMQTIKHDTDAEYVRFIHATMGSPPISSFVKSLDAQVSCAVSHVSRLKWRETAHRLVWRPR